MHQISKLLGCMLIIVFTSCGIDHASNPNQEKVDQELLATIDQFNLAFQAGDVESLTSMITDNYLHTNGNAKSIRKEDWLNYLRKRTQEIQLGTLEVIDYKMEEVEIELYGQTAIVTGKISVSNKTGDEVSRNEYRVTNIWVKETDKWKRAGFHDGKIK